MSDIQDAVILSACRTAVGKFLGSLSSVPATELGAIAVKEAVSRAGVDPGQVTEASGPEPCSATSPLRTTCSGRGEDAPGERDEPTPA